MSISFSRANRAITNDSFRPSLAGLLIAIFVLFAWGAWFLLARVPLYTLSAEVQQTRAGFIAKFTPEQMARIRAGQDATIAFGEQNISAEVMELANFAQNRMDPNTVRFAAYSNALPDGSPTRVQIEIERVAPLEYILKNLGSAPNVAVRTQ